MQVLGGGGRFVLRYNALRGNSVGEKPRLHTLGLADILAAALAAGDDGDGVGVLFKVVERTLKPVRKRKRRHIAVDGGAEDDKIFAPCVRIRAGVFNNRYLNIYKICKADKHQRHDAPPQPHGRKL